MTSAASDAMLPGAMNLNERKLAQEALQSSDARFRWVVESVGEGLLITDEREVVLCAYPRMTELTGYPEEMLERPATPPAAGGVAGYARAHQRRVKGAPERYEMRLKRRDGGFSGPR